MSEWHPIETAPKGRGVLMYTEFGGWLIGDWADYCEWNIQRITHWMPLPDPPITLGEP